MWNSYLQIPGVNIEFDTIASILGENWIDMYIHKDIISQNTNWKKKRSNISKQ